MELLVKIVPKIAQLAQDPLQLNLLSAKMVILKKKMPAYLQLIVTLAILLEEQNVFNVRNNVL